MVSGDHGGVVTGDRGEWRDRHEIYLIFSCKYLNVHNVQGFVFFIHFVFKQLCFCF